MSKGNELGKDKDMFDAYVSLRKIAQQYELEGKLAIPRVVFVGETSAGKSMLVQNFLRFPCAFSQSDVGTRCPVSYRLRYNPTLENNIIRITQPTGIKQAKDLADHLREIMRKIEHEKGFSVDEYVVQIESNQYRDFEILDVPGLIGGSHDSKHLKAVEQITERYVRDPAYLIVQLKSAPQIGVVCSWMNRFREFCLMDPAPCGSTLPPRMDYEDFTITIQTKFDLFMAEHQDGSQANEDMNKLVEHFNHQTLFVSMIFDGYNFGKHTYDENLQYIVSLSELECKRVDKWINEMQTLAQQSNKQYEPFDQARFRPLIGIDTVRNFIQDMWVKAFRNAVPKILEVLNELVEEQKLRYDTFHHLVEEKDVETIRSTYQHYIECFRSTLSNYVAYRAEVTNQFEFDKFSRTYKQIEEEYNKWPRKYRLTWCAYQTAEQLTNKPVDRQIYSLKSRYLGVRHFERIREVFFYMILSYQPVSRDQDYIETLGGLLFGGISDRENLEKAVRELLYIYIRETFAIGICWLTQIYSFFIDHFEQHVTSVLLRPGGEFVHLAIGHAKFLSYVRLEYHKTTRELIRRAVEATKHSRYAKMTYAAHSFSHFLRTLVESFPPRIKNHQQQEEEYPVSTINPLRLIFNSESILPDNRNLETGNYIPATRNFINEIYTAVKGLLLHDITTYYFANIVANIQQYDKINIRDALQYRIYKMSNTEIAQMSEIDLEEPLNELQKVYEKLITLEETCHEIKRAIQLFDGKMTTSNGIEKKQEAKIIHSKKRDRIHQELMNKFNDVKISNNENNDPKVNFNDKFDDEDGLRMLNNDSHICEEYLLELFRQHDLEDLKCGFLEGDDFNINETKNLQRHQSSSVASSILDDTSSLKTTYDSPKSDHHKSLLNGLREKYAKKNKHQK